MVVLKPKVLEEGDVGKVLRSYEFVGLKVFNCYVVNLDEEAVYDFYTSQKEVPSKEDLGSYFGGPSMVVGLQGNVIASQYRRLRFQQTYDVKQSKINTPEAISFWFEEKLL